MPISAVTLILASAIGAFAPNGPLELSTVLTDSSGHVVVVAIASNNTDGSVEFCGRWGFEVSFVPNQEGERKIAAYRAREEKRRLRAEADGEKYLSRCSPRLTPIVFDISGFEAGENWIKLAPGEAYSDTLGFFVEKEWYERWPGTIEVRYRLDLCEGTDAETVRIPANGLGGSVVATMQVP